MIDGLASVQRTALPKVRPWHRMRRYASGQTDRRREHLVPGRHGGMAAEALLYEVGVLTIWLLRHPKPTRETPTAGLRIPRAILKGLKYSNR